jgi:hypothetical protein
VLQYYRIALRVVPNTLAGHRFQTPGLQYIHPESTFHPIGPSYLNKFKHSSDIYTYNFHTNQTAYFYKTPLDSQKLQLLLHISTWLSCSGMRLNYLLKVRPAKHWSFINCQVTGSQRLTRPSNQWVNKIF